MSDAGLPNEGELIFYRAADGAVRVEVLYQEQTFRLNQKKIAELFGVEIPAINYHLKEIYASGELAPEATIRKFLRGHPVSQVIWASRCSFSY